MEKILEIPKITNTTIQYFVDGEYVDNVTVDEVQTPEQFEYECCRFRELCHGDWKSYMNFEVDKTVYIID